MTTITFFTDNDQLSGFNMQGHSGFAEEGEDIVCAALSSAAFMTANTITEILNIKPEVLIVDDGVMELQLNSKDYVEARTILQGFRLHITALCEQYGKFIKIKIRR